MLIDNTRVSASVNRWEKKKLHPDSLATQLGEGDRSAQVSGAQRQARLLSLLDEARDPVVARMLLERVIEGNDLVGVNYLSIGASRARAVCRIRLRDSGGRTLGFGTGFLVAPGVMMTNHHVIATAEQAAQAVAEFDYEYDEHGLDTPVTAFTVVTDPSPIANQALDFCIVRLRERSVDGKHTLDEFGWLPLNGTPGKAIVGEYLTIIQHPGGERKQVCVRENKLLRYDENGATLWYNTDTVAGSSGSPVFNGSWQVVALHHSGVPKKDAKGRWLTIDNKVWDRSMDESRVKWIANEGIRISAIFEYLGRFHGGDALARAVLESGVPPKRSNGNGNGNGHEEHNGTRSELVGDELHLTIPVRVAVRLDTNGHRSNGATLAAAPALPAQISNGSAIALLTPAIEAVRVDQSNYHERPGYNPNFLGTGKLRVPLPKVITGKRQVLRLNGQQRSELKYWNYSAVLHKARALAFFTAVNVDAKLRPKNAGRDGDRWYFDARIDEQFQLGPEFYGQQREFEMDRSQNPFDRGHLTRRLDAQWGETARDGQRNGDDSFHWTNCAPQHWKFNQGAKKWLGLEDYVIDNFAKKSERRACLFNGPVFDAPLSRVAEDGRVVPNLKGKRHRDPIFGGVAIPKLFYKIVVCERDGDLRAAAFLLSQEDLIATVDRLQGLPPLPEEKLSDAEARLYQVTVRDVARLTGLDFGSIERADVRPEESTELSGPLAIERLEEIRL